RGHLRGSPLRRGRRARPGDGLQLRPAPPAHGRPRRVIGLDGALDRLLHRRSYREAFLAERTEALGLADEDLEGLAGLDREALVREAEAVRDDLLHRRHRGSGGLLALYPRTLAAWAAAHPEDEGLAELLSRFMESAAFDAH